ncbi:MAG: DUF2007 domain-containing protein [Nitriliruptoraceae bacterium]
MARIQWFTDRTQADLACGLLVAHGISAVVLVDDAGGMRPDISFGIGGVAVVVPDDQLDEALELLDTPDGPAGSDEDKRPDGAAGG